MNANIQQDLEDWAQGRRVAVQPPVYFPSLSYLALMKSVDVWVIADTFQYSRQSFQNRCKVRSPDGWHWLTVPLVGGQHGTPIHQTVIDDKVAWESKHRRALRYNYRSSPFYDYYAPEILTLLSSPGDYLGPLTGRSVEVLRTWFGIETAIQYTSALPGRPASRVELAPFLKSAHILSEPDCVIPDRFHFGKAIAYKYEEQPYWQNFEGFVGGLTALDALFNLGPEAPSLLT